jgi:hypothetical protein
MFYIVENKKMPSVKLPSYLIRGKKTRKFPARIKAGPIMKAKTVQKHVPTRPPTDSDTFIKPNNVSFNPLLPPQLTGQQNYYNSLPDPNLNLSYDIDAGLPLNPFKRTTMENI